MLEIFVICTCAT